jgi:hypothetical protein
MLALAVALASLALSAPADAAQPFGGKLPYPKPKLIQVTENTKCDMGTILSVDPTRNLMRGTTPAGVVTYKVGSDVQVFSKEGKPVGGISALTAGLRYRAYYLVDDGARVLEIDLD